VLLVDETDKADIEVEGLLLEVLSDFQITVPELGTVTAVRRPFVVLTSNATRELSEALKRRCLYLHMDYPDGEREKAIVLARVPEVAVRLAEQVVATVRALRAMDLRKPPSIAETIDWTRTMLALGVDTLDETVAAATLGVVLKHRADQDRAVGQLHLPQRA
jgi:MoxR-like ATPase